MNKAFSLYLDFTRIGASALVFLAHARYSRFTNGWLDPIGAYGLEAVMLFFVLSGIVIAYVVSEKETTPLAYFSSRFTRLYSVVIPAILITLVADIIGAYLYPIEYNTNWYASPYLLLNIVINFLFLNEIWFASVQLFSNSPFWSMGYEFWYYMLYGALIFTKRYARIVLLLLICLLIGPKILLLFPLWLAGVFIYHFSKRRLVSIPLGCLYFLGSILIFMLMDHYKVHDYCDAKTAALLGSSLFNKLSWSQSFIYCDLLGILISFHYIGFLGLAPVLSPIIQRFKKPIQYLAVYTFPLYLLHYPLLHFFAALIKAQPSRLFDEALILVATLICVWLAGNAIERKKGKLKTEIDKILNRVSKKMPYLRLS